MKHMTSLEKVHEDRVECVTITPSGREIISLGRDQVIKITDFY